MRQACTCMPLACHPARDAAGTHRAPQTGLATRFLPRSRIRPLPALCCHLGRAAAPPMRFHLLRLTRSDVGPGFPAPPLPDLPRPISPTPRLAARPGADHQGSLRVSIHQSLGAPTASSGNLSSSGFSHLHPLSGCTRLPSKGAGAGLKELPRLEMRSSGVFTGWRCVSDIAALDHHSLEVIPASKERGDHRTGRSWVPPSPFVVERNGIACSPPWGLSGHRRASKPEGRHPSSPAVGLPCEAPTPELAGNRKSLICGQIPRLLPWSLLPHDAPGETEPRTLHGFASPAYGTPSGFPNLLTSCSPSLPARAVSPGWRPRD